MNAMKTLYLPLLILALLSMVSTRAFAYDIAVENENGVTIYYNRINGGKELEVTYKQDHNCYSGEVVIPEKVNNIKVTCIGDGAFAGCPNLTSVTIPNTVTTIGSYAFRNSSSLTTAIISENVSTFGSYAFHNCSSLTSIVVPNSVKEIGNNAFEGCTSLTSIIIGNSVSTICAEAFYECTNLTTVIIPSSVKSIGKNAFWGCNNLITIISLNENPDVIYETSNAYSPFELNTYNNATLFVPEGSIDKYKSRAGWRDFVHIKEGKGPDNEIPDKKQCAKPTISYRDAKLLFNSDTEGAMFHHTITDTDIKSEISNEVQLTVTYYVSVYAMMSGYVDSEKAEATLCWIEVDPQKEGITEGTATDAKQLKAIPVLIQAADGQISVEGAPEGTKVAVYDANGMELGAAISRGGTTLIPTHLASGSIAIVKIGEKAVKIKR